MGEKLDLERAWNEATSLLSANRDVVLIVAAVFFFLPNVISALVLPSQDAFVMQMQALGDQPDPQEVMALFADHFAGSWWIYLIITLVQAVGMLGLLALLTDKSRPTVGEALTFGGKALIPYIIAQILLGLAMVVPSILLIALGAAINAALAVIMVFVGIALMVYIWVKLSLTSPVIAIEGIMNPINALTRSWRLTKGNSLRLFALYVLLIVAVVVLSLVAGLIFALFAVLGETIGLLVTAIGGGLISMVYTTIMLAVLAAVHRQLSGGSTARARETFE
ncbi:hypothetical protein [Aurantiacibacter rhizosphaerae]|uniref:Glycerophosphoryl diester phosphodiesterase membrane domain-containing protein n=1 Tax=Aurantiacibacter rhizosphaerae TaxID=2691582 RepID=A0A844XBY6_9SPHN|nr:hypothetical protein [Aurantiacibacter rhizosphaerae]MWV27222.1 hypothetical protein [Aurantiacibacter rhizosphaerae]